MNCEQDEDDNEHLIQLVERRGGQCECMFRGCFWMSCVSVSVSMIGLHEQSLLC